MRLLHPVKPPRDVSCFNCGHPFTTIAQAQSSQCPKCGGYVSLLDYIITEPWNRRIQTCGNVLIQKTASVSGTTLHCHDLTVLGALAGSAVCSGDLIIRSHGKIIGTVQCRHLRIEKGARVEFLNPVTATTATIDGHVRGQISCTGPVTLEKRARLQGLVRASSLIVKPGAKHTGTIEMISEPPATDH
jgi:cytoskeletal protein CcmA (bactofilin family)